MFAVVFSAQVGELDDVYYATAARLRELALSQYGCIDFVSIREKDREIAVSYWESDAQIVAWKQDPEHQAAQELGRSRWYRAYTVQVVEIKREYSHAERELSLSGVVVARD